MLSAVSITTLPVKKNNTNNNGAGRKGLKFLRQLPENERDIPDACLQKTAEVVCISEPKNSRVGVGYLKMMVDDSRKWVLFSPNDPRMPRMMLPISQAPPGFCDRPQDFSKYLYIVRLAEWPETAQFARGQMVDFLGMAGDIKAETEGLLVVNNIDRREFSPETIASLPVEEGSKWKIEEDVLKGRRDFRGEVVFTIDPATARDLDDALHIRPIDNCDGAGKPGWEVGVHIADVAYFVKQGTELDEWAALRATSVYLVHEVIPMLPRILCEELCSLTAGVDRLTMSVVWHIDDDANIYEEWFGRSVICSCSKLAYEHAQEIIDNPEKEIIESEFPPISSGKNLEDVKLAVLRLNKLAELLCEKRGKHGSLRIEMPKLCFNIDNKTGFPLGVSVYKRKQANSLVEEFMLLANMAVARRIEAEFPKTALLRGHPPPRPHVLRQVLERVTLAGFDVDGASSGSLALSLRKYAGQGETAIAILQILSNLLLRSMRLAVYFCTGIKKSKSEYAHYALSVPFYTHFTSPIRRYPDIMVHRLLAAALGYEEAPNLNVEQISALASHCNDRKCAAKIVSDSSAEMFFGLYVKECGPLVEKAVVLAVLDQAFDVLIVKFGIVKRVYINKVSFAREPKFEEGILATLTLYWNNEGSPGVLEQTIRLCTVLDVTLSSLSNGIKFQAAVEQPKSEKMTTLFDC